MARPGDSVRKMRLRDPNGESKAKVGQRLNADHAEQAEVPRVSARIGAAQVRSDRTVMVPLQAGR